MWEASPGGLILVENDPGVPAGRDCFAGLSARAREDLQILLEGKAIGTAQLRANVLARDSAMRRTGLADISMQRFRMREASTNAGRALKRIATRTRRAIRPVLQRLVRGESNLRETQEAAAPLWRQAYEEVRRVGRQASALEELGDPTIFREEETWFRGAVREELAYWNTFLAEVDAGTVPQGRVWERFDAYLRALRFMYESARVQALPDNTLFYWMGPEDENNCTGCAYLMERSPFTKDNIPAVPRDGSTRCLTRCRHRIVVRVPRDLREVFRRRRDLPKRAVMVRELKALKERRRTVRASRAARNPFRGEPITAPPRQFPRTATFRESLEESRRPMRFHVFRVASGRGRGLADRNAADAAGIIVFLDSNAASQSAHGDHVEMYEVTVDQDEFGPYEAIRGKARRTTLVGRDVKGGYTWYSFPDGAPFRARFVKAIPVTDATRSAAWERAFVKAGGDVAAYDKWAEFKAKNPHARMEDHLPRKSVFALLRAGWPHQFSRGREQESKDLLRKFGIRESRLEEQPRKRPDPAKRAAKVAKIQTKAREQTAAATTRHRERLAKIAQAAAEKTRKAALGEKEAVAAPASGDIVDTGRGGKAFERAFVRALDLLGLKYVENRATGAAWDILPQGKGWHRLIKDQEVNIKVHATRWLFSDRSIYLTVKRAARAVADGKIDEAQADKRVARAVRKALTRKNISDAVFMKPKDRATQTAIVTAAKAGDVRELKKLMVAENFATKRLGRYTLDVRIDWEADDAEDEGVFRNIPSGYWQKGANIRLDGGAEGKRFGVTGRVEHAGGILTFFFRDRSSKGATPYHQARTRKESTDEASLAGVSLGVPRHEMPQIPSDRIPAFVAWLGAQGVRTQRKMILATRLHPTQSEFNYAKTLKFARKKVRQRLHMRKPVIVSSDLYILDGHHRWLEVLQSRPTDKINTIVVDMRIKHLLPLAFEFPGIGSLRRVEEDTRLDGMWVRDIEHRAGQGDLRGLHVVGPWVGGKFRQEAIVTPAFSKADVHGVDLSDKKWRVTWMFTLRGEDEPYEIDMPSGRKVSVPAHAGEQTSPAGHDNFKGIAPALRAVKDRIGAAAEKVDVAESWSLVEAWEACYCSHHEEESGDKEEDDAHVKRRKRAKRGKALRPREKMLLTDRGDRSMLRHGGVPGFAPADFRQRAGMDESLTENVAPTWDVIPYSSMRIQDVARLFDGATRASKINPQAIAKLIGRLIGTLEFSVMAAVGRPEADRMSKLIRGGLQRLSQKVTLKESQEMGADRLKDLLCEGRPSGAALAVARRRAREASRTRAKDSRGGFMDPTAFAAALEGKVKVAGRYYKAGKEALDAINRAIENADSPRRRDRLRKQRVRIQKLTPGKLRASVRGKRPRKEIRGD